MNRAPALFDTPTSRRDMLRRLGAGGLLALGTAAWPGCRSTRTRAGARPFQFLAVNDLHHASKECDPWFEKLTRQMRGHPEAEFALVLGDLADDAKPESHMAVRDHLRQLRLPTYVQVGNHDLRTATDRSGYDAAFPKSVNYRFEHRGWQFVGIDSTQGVDYEKTKIQPATLSWLDENLPKLDPRRPTILFTHFPLGAGVKMRPLNADAVLERFLDFNLQGVLGGHYHAYTATPHRDIEVLTNRCCARVRDNHDGTKEKGYWVMHCAEGRLSREFVTFAG
jgi:hypothetical protein